MKKSSQTTIKQLLKNIKINLMKFEQNDYVGNGDLPYLRVWTKPINTYASNYSKFDISVAPIKNHIFNRMKSQLKVIEGGIL